MSATDLFAWQPPLVPAPYVKNSDTSREAAESIDHALPHLERVVFDAIRAAGASGLTCDECELRTDLSHQTASARMRGLEQRGRIRKTDDKRVTRSGRRAAVYLIAGGGRP